MILSDLAILNYKNCEQLEIVPKAGFNCFTGKNGQGKTNVLDAIYTLSFCKSFINPVDSQNIRNGEDYYMISGTYAVNDDDDVHVVCSLKKGQKKQVKKNKKAYQKLADHIGLIPIVLIAPQDAELILGGSDVRRKFVDALISQHNKEYLASLIDYNRVLSQRNAVLKQFAMAGRFDPIVLETYNDLLNDHGTAIHQARKDFMDEFLPLFESVYHRLSGKTEQVSLTYKSDLNNGDTLKVLLEQNLSKDKVLQYTTVGIHKDDLVFELDGKPIKKFGSQGQQKTYTIALKLAQIDYLKAATGKLPILLLDDIFDKLDDVRIGELINIINDSEIEQCFITDTSADRLTDLFTGLNIDYTLFEVADGRVE